VADVEPVTLLDGSLAVMVTEPVLPAEHASNRCPGPESLSETFTTLGVSDENVTSAVMSCVLLSEKVPVATKIWHWQTVRVAFAGVSAMLCRIALVTVKVV